MISIRMGLAPLAVHPDHRRRGIKILKDRGCPFVVVLGHPDYYPRNLELRILHPGSWICS